MGKYKKACREWLKGCSCADSYPGECPECTKAFYDHLVKLEAEERKKQGVENLPVNEAIDYL